jgi:hypothetical protein
MSESNFLKSPVTVLLLVVITIVLSVLVPIAAPLIAVILIGGGIVLYKRSEPNARTPSIIVIIAGSVLLLAVMLFLLTQLKVG